MKPAPHHRDGSLSGPILALVCGILLLAGLVIWFLLSKDSAPVSPGKGNQQTTRTTDNHSFVGSQSCAECHAELYKSYQHHPMGNSLTRPTNTTIIEDYHQNNSFMSGGRRYRVTLPENTGTTSKTTIPQPNQLPQHHEKMVDADGNDIYDQSIPISFVVGSGSRGRSYITQHDEWLFQSPITWYVEDQTWDLSPGYAPSGHQRFERVLSESCLSCHAGKINFLEDQTNRYNAAQPFQELSIGCERCHGPGRQHVDAHRQGRVSTDQFIVNPQKLASRERNSVCYQCHLSGKHRVLRYGKRPRDFRPGQPLRDTWTVFVTGTGVSQDQQARLTSNVEQMHASRCFQQSNGKMGCTSCHDPHYYPKSEERTAYYRARCLRCHEQHGCSLPAAERNAPPALNSCKHCHMQKLVTSDIAHSSQADHRILRFPTEVKAGSDDLESTMTTNALPWELFDGALDTLPSWDIDRATAIGSFHEARKKNDQKTIVEAMRKLTKVVNQVPADHKARLELARMHYQLEDYPAALRHARIVLESNPTEESALVLAGFSAQFTKNFQDAVEYFAKKLSQNPRDANLYITLAEVVGRQQDLLNAIKVLDRGLQVDPSSIALHSMLAECYRRTGQTQKSQQHLDLIESIRFSMQRDQKP